MMGIENMRFVRFHEHCRVVFVAYKFLPYFHYIHMCYTIRDAALSALRVAALGQARALAARTPIASAVLVPVLVHDL